MSTSVLVTRGLVVLVCATGHNHQMAPDQARRLHQEACCWCGAPMVGIYLERAWPSDRDALCQELSQPQPQSQSPALSRAS